MWRVAILFAATSFYIALARTLSHVHVPSVNTESRVRGGRVSTGYELEQNDTDTEEWHKRMRKTESVPGGFLIITCPVVTCLLHSTTIVRR